VAAKETSSPPPPPPQLDKEAVEAALDKEEKEKKGTSGQDASVRAGSESLKSAEGTLLDNSVVSLPTVSTNTHDEAPEVVVQEATPGSPEPTNPIDAHVEKTAPRTPVRNTAQQHDNESLTSTSIRKQSLVATADVDVIKALLHDEGIEGLSVVREAPSLHRGYTSGSGTTALNASMLSRKVWVKRPHQAATIVLIKEDDMVDEAKEAILSKYRNQLHRHFDAPDITIRISTRGGPVERILNPDEFLCRTLDSHYPGGQSVDEALLIDVPSRRTPRPSPRAHHSHHAGHHERHAYNSNYYDEGSARPHESATDYFPPMPPMNLGQPSPLLTNTSHDSHSHDSRRSHAAHERAMSVLNTGQVPPLPSPGAVSRRAHLAKQHSRPGNARAHTSSPTTLANSVASRGSRPRLDSTASTEKHPQVVSSTGAIPTPPVPSQAKEIPAITNTQATPNPPTPRVSSPRPGGRSRKTRQKQKDDGPTAMHLPPGILDTAVPPINVLIVEDNMINMRLLEQFVRKLGVRWATAINGVEAVNKWRQGGFHLVLMDIQLPIMSGLEATKEIRRLERVNNIGVFSSASESAPDLSPGDEGECHGLKDEDKLFEEGYSRLFKSPVIIVALTASNLQSDRHEALAAGCNDFLTKVRSTSPTLPTTQIYTKGIRY
jgi:osomolarity two-component system response regulator SSK1